MASTDPLRELGVQIRAARRKVGLSQEGCGELAGLHRNEVGALERGEKNVSFLNLLRVCAALKTTQSELLRTFGIRSIHRLPPKRTRTRHREK